MLGQFSVNKKTCVTIRPRAAVAAHASNVFSLSMCSQGVFFCNLLVVFSYFQIFSTRYNEVKSRQRICFWDTVSFRTFDWWKRCCVLLLVLGKASYTLPDCELLSFAFTKSSTLIAGCTSTMAESLKVPHFTILTAFRLCSFYHKCQQHQQQQQQQQEEHVRSVQSTSWYKKRL